MSGPVIIRLQNLPLEARSIDIRKFFDGLVIPDGGVHIIGGERGDAFIAFQSDEDARLAMARDGNILCNAKIKLFLSSKNEMQNVITAARNQLQQLQAPVPVVSAAPVVTQTPIEKILSNNKPQQNPLDLLNSITKLFSKPTQPQPEANKSEHVETSSNISINEILNILKTQKVEAKPVEQVKPSLLPTPAGPAPKQEVKKTPLLTTPQAGAPPPRLEPIIKVKNFAHNCSYKDVRSFLQGIQIEHNGIKFSDKGQAFVKLVNIVDLKKALCRNGQFYEERQIEVVQSNEGELNKKESQKSDTTTGFYIKIYGLPAKFDDMSLKNMFNNVKFIKIVTSTPTPIASKIVNQDGSQETKTIIKAKKLCEVETQLDVERALTRQDERVGKSKIQIFQISRSEYERELSQIRPGDGENMQSDGDGEDEDDEEYYVLMTGIPFSARIDDVRNFLQNVNCKEIHVLNDAETQKPLGECLCELYTRSDRDKCLAKSDSMFRNRNVKIKVMNAHEAKRLKDKKKPMSRPLMSKPALLATPVSPTEKPKLLDEQSHKRPYQSGYSSNKRVKQSSPIDLPPLPAELQKYKHSIVLLSNVSYEATREDILELFKYYSPIEQTLKIRHDDRGQPTGDAIVACRSHDEASKACKSLNGTDFMGRSIRAVLINP